MALGLEIPGTLPAAQPQPGAAESVVNGASPWSAGINAAAGVLTSALAGPGPSSNADGSLSDRSGRTRTSILTDQTTTDRSIVFGDRGASSQGATATPSATSTASGGAGSDTRGAAAAAPGGLPPVVWAILAALGLAMAYLLGRR